MADGLSYVFALLPSFSAAQAMSDLYKNYKLEQRCLVSPEVKTPQYRSCCLGTFNVDWRSWIILGLEAHFSNGFLFQMGACREDEAHVPYLSLTRPGIG